MKKKESINHFTGREQAAIMEIKNQIVAKLQPLIIYFIDAAYESQAIRSVFSPKQRDEQWRYNFRLLLIREDDKPFDEDKLQQFIDSIASPISLKIIHCSFTEMKKQLLDFNLFFTWVKYQGILLYQRNLSVEHLPLLQYNVKQYKRQVNEWYKEDPNLSEAFTKRMEPLPAFNKEKSEKKYRTFIIRNAGVLRLSFKANE